MSTLSDCRLSIDVDRGREVDAGDTTVTIEHEYENVGFPITRAANSSAGMFRGKLAKKPKPGPKPNYVALKVAELNLQQKINSNEMSSKLSLAKKPAHGPIPVSPPVDKSSRSTKTSLVNGGAQNFVSSSDHLLYDAAVRVDLDVLHRISEDMTSADAPKKSSLEPTSTTTQSTRTPAVYTTPDDEEPIYDEAILVFSRVAEEPLYEEVVGIETDRLQTLAEPVYAVPDEIMADASSTEYCSDHGNFLYEEALPVNKMALPNDDSDTATK